MTRWIPIMGTHGWKPNGNEKEWWHKHSTFSTFLATQGVVIYDHPEGQFVWSTDLDGLGFRGSNDWAAAGEALRYYLQGVPYSHVNLIVHSHGLQVALYAAAKGLKIRRLVSVGSPPNRKMDDIAKLARPNIGKWLHIYTKSWREFWIRLGQLFDGRLGWKYEHPLADTNERFDGGDHGAPLTNSKFFPLWKERGWVDFLTHGIRG